MNATTLHALSSIRSRDPFVLPAADLNMYYLYAAADLNAADGRTLGFDCFRSRDLDQWEGPLPVFRPAADFWATMNYWAPEVHRYLDRYYLLATFKAPQRYRGTQILVADTPEGPFAPLTDRPVTPPDWECLDGTLFVDETGKPWIVFCQEWVQVHNGGMWAMPLTADLTTAAGRPVFLFNASEAPWKSDPTWPANDPQYRFPNYITDGPFLYRTREQVLLMLWSSFGRNGYTVGIARSESGGIEGPWHQDREPLFDRDGGHAMLFRTFDNRLMMTLHQPNTRPEERARFLELEDVGHGLAVREE